MNRHVLFFILIFPLLSISQNFNAGIIGGLNTSQVSGDNLSGFNKLGARLGAFVNQSFKNFDLQMELQYINKGSRESVQKNTYNTGYKFQLNYIEMPWLIKKTIYKKTAIEAGLKIGYLLNWEETYDGLESSGLDVEKIEYSFLVGFVQKITDKLYLNSRVSNSIFPIRAHFPGQTQDVNSKGQYNTSVSFVLSYYLANKVKR